MLIKSFYSQFCWPISPQTPPLCPKMRLSPWGLRLPHPLGETRAVWENPRSPPSRHPCPPHPITLSPPPRHPFPIGAIPPQPQPWGSPGPRSPFLLQVAAGLPPQRPPYCAKPVLVQFSFPNKLLKSLIWLNLGDHFVLPGELTHLIPRRRAPDAHSVQRHSRVGWGCSTPRGMGSM